MDLNAGPRSPERGVYCNRTLNLRTIRAIGYDMDYTLIHYQVDEWERAAFADARDRLALLGWPTSDLEYDPTSVIQGLAFDIEKGNLVKATRFGYIVRADHGTKALPFDELKAIYSATTVDLGDERWQFVNTLFSLSEAILYSQLVDLLDAGQLPELVSYRELYRKVRQSIDETHTEGALKQAILSAPERFVDLDPDLALTLLDQRNAGKTLMLVTNSDWEYCNAMMQYSLNPFLPNGETWRTMFDLIIVEARKPFFFLDRQPAYLMVDEEFGLLRSHSGRLILGRVYAGGDATMVERTLSLSGAEILYVGDHLFGDMHSSKASLRWRTALILRELEAEIAAAVEFAPRLAELRELMRQKVALENEVNQLRLARLRRHHGYGNDIYELDPGLNDQIRKFLAEVAKLDATIAPLAQEASQLGNARWGSLLRAGNDKSLYARQMEAYADVYSSRVSNLGALTPYAYLRGTGGMLPHEPLVTSGNISEARSHPGDPP